MTLIRVDNGELSKKKVVLVIATVDAVFAAS
jgi:hypothetical protein